MKLKFLAVAAALALSGPAFAQTVLGPIAPGTTTTFSGTLGSVEETDTFTFNLITPVSSAVSVLSLYFGSTAYITGVTFAGEPLTAVTLPLGNASFPINLSSFTGAGAAASSFALAVTGRSLTGDPVSYSGSFVTAVPEPGSLALMMAGLGVVGFVASRRRKNG